MSSATIFNVQLVLGYVPWLLCFGAYIWPRLAEMDRAEAQRAIAVLHSFRFFGLVFIIPGVVGPNLSSGFAAFAAYGDFATGLLAMAALLTVRLRPVFWPFVVAFNVVGAIDIIVDYYHGTQVGLPRLAGELGAAYAIPIIYVPVLMITHFAALYLLDPRRRNRFPQCTHDIRGRELSEPCRHQSVRCLLLRRLPVRRDARAGDLLRGGPGPFRRSCRRASNCSPC